MPVLYAVVHIRVSFDVPGTAMAKALSAVCLGLFNGSFHGFPCLLRVGIYHNVLSHGAPHSAQHTMTALFHFFQSSQFWRAKAMCLMIA